MTKAKAPKKNKSTTTRKTRKAKVTTRKATTTKPNEPKKTGAPEQPVSTPIAKTAADILLIPDYWEIADYSFQYGYIDPNDHTDHGEHINHVFNCEIADVLYRFIPKDFHPANSCNVGNVGGAMIAALNALLRTDEDRHRLEEVVSEKEQKDEHRWLDILIYQKECRKFLADDDDDSE